MGPRKACGFCEFSPSVCTDCDIDTMKTYWKYPESKQKIFDLGSEDSNAAVWDFLIGVSSTLIATENSLQFIGGFFTYALKYMWHFIGKPSNKDFRALERAPLMPTLNYTLPWLYSKWMSICGDSCYGEIILATFPDKASQGSAGFARSRKDRQFPQ